MAQDVPLYNGDRDLPKEQLQHKRYKWLCEHDQRTEHLTSMLPLVVGLPMRLTDTVDRKWKLYKGRRCWLESWVPHPEEERRGVVKTIV